MVWGILGALDEEVALVREQMQVQSTVQCLGTTFYSGTIADKSIVLVCCGIGKVNAAVCTATMVQKYGVDCVINVGIAGAMQHGLKILDVVISTEVGFHDQDDIMLKYYPKREFFHADDTLRALCAKACAALTLTGKAVEGRIVSGDKFVNDRVTKGSISRRYSPACVEMEGAAVGHTSFMLDKPFLIIRTMSDAADDAADQTYDDFLHRAAQQSAQIVLKMLAIADHEWTTVSDAAC